MATIAEQKAQAQKWTPTWAFNVVLKDGTPRYWSTHAFTWNSHPYEAIVQEFSPFKIEGGGVYGVDAVVEINLVLNNADLSLNAILPPSNWQGGTIQPFFFFRDLDGTATSDSIAYPQFIIDLPTETWPKVLFSAHNKWNLARKVLPLSVVTRKDRYPFPSTAAERLAAGSDPTSEFYPSGYDPANGKGNWKTESPQEAYTADDYNGLRDVDGPATKVCLRTIGLEVRYGGFGKIPPTISYTPKKGEHAQFQGSANEGKYGQAVPLVFGTCRIAPITLDTGGPPNWNGGRLSHLLLCDGINFAPTEEDMGIEDVLEVRLPGAKDGKDYIVPETSNQTSYTGAWSVQSGFYGHQTHPGADDYRNFDYDDDFPDPDFKDRDPYSGLAFLNLGLPKELGLPDQPEGPKVEATVQGLTIETWDESLVSTWQWSDNPVWIFIHLLKLLRWSTDDIDKDVAYDAAAYCDEALSNGKKRFRCNLALTQQVKAADVLRGIRNNCRLYTSYGVDGKLQLKIKRIFTEEGGSAFTIDSTNIARDNFGQPQVKKFHKSAFEIANVFNCNFQNEDNQYSSDSYSRADVTAINQIDERIPADSITAILGIPSFDQAERILNWMKYEHVDLNEYYQIRCTLAMIEAKVGQVGTITETRLGLTSQQCRILSLTPGPDDTIDIIVQKHADAGYGDDSTLAPSVRASSDTTFSPRSVGGLSGITGNPTLSELFIQDDVNHDLYRRKIKVQFTPPPTDYESIFSRRTLVSDVAVQTTGGSITGNQILFVEVCPRKSGVDGLASDYLTVNVPAGTNTNKFTLTCQLPSEADQYVVRVGTYPGRLFEQAVVATPGTDPFTVTVSSISAIDSSSLSPDPGYDHARVFYYFSGSENILRDAGATKTPDEDSLIFEPEIPESADTTITVIICSANAAETDFYPLGLAPSATLTLTKDTGNPSGASSLEVLQNSDDANIPPGQAVFQFNRDTANFDSIFGAAVVLSEALPAEGPYKAERDGNPSEVIETGTCTVTAGSKAVTVTRAANSAVLGRVLLIYTNDISPDSDLEGEIVIAQGVNSLTVNTPFNKSGTFSYAIIKRWWDLGTPDTGNEFYQWFPIDQLGEKYQTVWRTPPVPAPVGEFYATAYSRNIFGVGERLTAGPATFIDISAPHDTVLPGAVDSLSLAESGGGKFVADWEEPATGMNTFCDVIIQWSTDSGMATPDQAAAWGPVLHLESVDPERILYFQVALRNESGIASNALTKAAVEATGRTGDYADYGWGPLSNIYGPVNSGKLITDVAATEAPIGGDTFLVVFTRTADGRYKFTFGAEFPETNNNTADLARFQIARDASFSSVAYDVTIAAGGNGFWYTTETHVWYIRCAYHNDQGWSDWSDTLIRQVHEATEGDDTSYPSVPRNVTVLADDAYPDIDGKEMVVDWDLPETNNTSIFGFDIQIYTSATFPTNTLIFSSASGSGSLGDLYLDDAGVTFLAGHVGKTIWFYSSLPGGDGDDVLIGTAQIEELITAHRVRLSSPLRKGGTGLIYKLFSAMSWDQVTRCEYVPVTRNVSSGLVQDSHYQRVITGLGNGTYYVRVKAANLLGGIWSAVAGPVTIDGFGTADYKAQSVSVEKLSGDARAQHGVIFETFETLPSSWNLRSGTLGSIVDGQGQAGGKVYRCTSACWLAFPSNIPYDSSKLYRMRARVRRTSPGTAGVFYIGVEGVAADGVTLCNVNGADSYGSQHYICAYQVSPSDGVWTDYTGWFKGWNAAGGGTPSTDPTDPKPLHSNVRYFRPVMLLNNPSGTETADIDEIAIDVFDEEGVDRTYTGINTDGTIANNKVVTNSLLDGAATSAKVNKALMGWSHALTFSVTDANTVAWAAGTITLSDGSTLNISAGNTGNMAARNYIFLDIAISTTVLQLTTTAANAVGDGRILIATATLGTAEASYFVFSGNAAIKVNGADIAARSIVAEKVVAGTLTGNELAFETITGNHLVANAIDGMTITGALVRTAALGNRVEMDVDGLRIYGDGLLKANNIYPISGSLIFINANLDIPSGSVFSIGSVTTITATETLGPIVRATTGGFKIAAGVTVVDNSQTHYAAAGGYCVNSVKVVGAQGAAVADATDAATVILRLNDLLARLRTHGLIAT